MFVRGKAGHQESPVLLHTFIEVFDVCNKIVGSGVIIPGLEYSKHPPPSRLTQVQLLERTTILLPALLASLLAFSYLFSRLSLTRPVSQQRPSLLVKQKVLGSISCYAHHDQLHPWNISTEWKAYLQCYRQETST